MNGLNDAKLDHQPVVAILGQQARAALGGHYQQEVDLVSLFKDVAHEYVHMVSDPAQVRHLVDRAIRIALAERTVTCIIVPNDVQTMDAVPEPEHAHGTIHSSVGYSRPRVVPTEEDLDRADQQRVRRCARHRGPGQHQHRRLPQPGERRRPGRCAA